MGNVASELRAIRAALGETKFEQQTCSLREAAKRLGVSARLLRAMLLAGEIRSTMLNGVRVIPLDEIARR